MHTGMFISLIVLQRKEHDARSYTTGPRVNCQIAQGGKAIRMNVSILMQSSQRDLIPNKGNFEGREWNGVDGHVRCHFELR